jgi:hypothetical protein
MTGFRFNEEHVLTPQADDLYAWYLDSWSPLLAKEYLKIIYCTTFSRDRVAGFIPQ